MWAALLIVQLLALGSLASEQGSQQVDCQALGFTGLTLCSDCAELGTYVKDEELVAECRQCCAEESAKEETKFSSAVLEICPHSLRSFPHIEGFIDNKAQQWANLKVRMRYGAAPRLIMKGHGGQSTNVRIDKWHTHHIEEYLADRLRSGGSGNN